MIMTEKETLLECISMIKAEAEIDTVYGDRWRIEDYRLRRSLIAGQICLLFADLERLKAKANRRPKSKGARKAQRELLAGCRKLSELLQVITESYDRYYPASPQYLTEPLHTLSYTNKSRIEIHKKPLEIRMPYTIT